ncbi:MAG TPA: LysR family transcriptional regulator [Dongiaceae bacterium]|jgi:DNA-binding transcriptional LysR family regulator|nr:LysR family transcriptional regulator [Dongiaceae bacterium]
MTDDSLPFDLRSLEIFLSVCDHGTMSGAARVLGLTQSAVSQTILELEQRIHTTLFDRNVRPLGMTLSGVVLRQRAGTLLADARQIAPLLRDVRRGKLPQIRVGLIDSLERLLLPSLPERLLEFADRVSFVSGLTSSHVDDISARRLDIFLGVDEFEALEGLETWPLLDEPYIIVTPRGTPAPARLQDLIELSETLNFVRYHHRRKVGLAIERHLRRIGLDLPRSLEFDTPYGVSTAVAAGQGWAISTPLCVYESGALAEQVECHPFPGAGFQRRLALITRSRELARVPKEVTEIVTERLRGEFIPAVTGNAPWLKRMLVVGAHRQHVTPAAAR